MMQRFAHYLWFKSKVSFRWLIPLSWLYACVVKIRHALYQIGVLKSYRSPVPVLIVGNLTVGGNGKTPMVLWTIEELKKRQIKVAVISRGYGASPPYTPFAVRDSNDPKVTGDEPLLIYQRTGVDVVISSHRQKAIELIIKTAPDVQLIISDDGLQHYALERDIEWVVVDAVRQFGNKQFLPAGPLRESLKRLNCVDAIIFNAGVDKTLMTPETLTASLNLPLHSSDSSLVSALLKLEAKHAVNLITYETKPLSEFKEVNAIAGIGFPERFYNLLVQEGLSLITTRDFADHHAFDEKDLTEFINNPLPLLMTEKDASKCQSFARSHCWYIPVESIIAPPYGEALISQLLTIVSEK